MKKLLQQIVETVPEGDMVIVDDDSPDGTAQEVEEFAAATDHHVQLITRIGQRGLGTAYKAGFQYGLERDYDVFITMDADMSHNPARLPAILAAIQDHDVVIGARYIRDGGTINWPVRRILLSWFANRFARHFLQLKGHDVTSGYRAYRRAILESIGLDSVKSNGYSYLVEMLFYAQQNTARICEIPIIFFDRTMGKSKISKRAIFLGVFTLFRLRFKR